MASQIGRSIASTLLAALLLPGTVVPAQEGAPEKIDLKVLHEIKAQAFQHSQVMDHLFYIADVYGPRVSGSPNHRAAAEWIMTRLKSYGLQNVHLEPWGPFGNSWQYKKFYGALVEPNYAPLIGFPLAWTPGTNGPVTAEAVLAPIHTQADFEKYRGKLKGKIVLIADPKVVLMHTEPEARRLTTEEIDARTVVPDPSRLGAFGGGGRPGAPAPCGNRPPRPPAARSSSATTPASSSPTKASSSPSTTAPTATAAPSSPASAARRTPRTPPRPPWSPSRPSTITGSRG